MELTLQKEAAQWYKDELELDEDQSVRFFVRYGGVDGLKPGFSLGVRPDKPAEPIAEANEEGVHFFIESDDAWYFDEHDVKVEYDPTKEEPDFEYSNGSES